MEQKIYDIKFNTYFVGKLEEAFTVIIEASSHEEALDKMYNTLDKMEKFKGLEVDIISTELIKTYGNTYIIIP